MGVKTKFKELLRNDMGVIFHFLLITFLMPRYEKFISTLSAIRERETSVESTSIKEKKRMTCDFYWIYFFPFLGISSNSIQN
jgi:hypothetical protein